MRSRLYEILEGSRDHDVLGQSVKLGINGLILANIIALVAQSHLGPDDPRQANFFAFEAFSVAVFSVEYILRVWVCVEAACYSHPVKGRLRFMVSPMAVVDLIAIAPFFFPLSGAIDLRAMRAFRLIRLARVFKLGRYSRSIRLLGRVLGDKKADLASALFLSLLLLIIASCLMFFVENPAQPDKFPTITHTVWWGVATLTTVGYGDVVPITALGKVLGATVSLLGVGLFALPAGIIASGYVEAIGHDKDKRAVLAACPHCGEALDKPEASGS